MEFQDLPTEIIRMILLAAVRARTLRRALRLRLVSRSWNVLVELALYDSGHFDLYNDSPTIPRYGIDFSNRLFPMCPEPDGAPLLPYGLPSIKMAVWCRFLIHRATHGTRVLTPRLMIIRRLAERLVSSRRGTGVTLRNAADEEASEILGCLTQLCDALLRLEGHSRIMMPQPQAAPAHPIPEEHFLFRRALLVAAAAVNDLDLARTLLLADWALWDDWETTPIERSSKTTAFSKEHDPWVQHLLGFFNNPGCTTLAAFKIAAMLGHADMIALFVNHTLEHTQNLADPLESEGWRRLDNLRVGARNYALPNGQPRVVDVVLGPAPGENGPPEPEPARRQCWGWRTSSPELLDRFMHLEFACIEARIRRGHKNSSEEVLAERRRLRRSQWLAGELHDAAAAGNFSMVRHLVDKHGVPVDGTRPGPGQPYWPPPISKAALGNHTVVVRWLLDRGASTDLALLDAAKAGAVEIVELLLEHGRVEGEETPAILSPAMVEAVRSESDAIFSRLMKAGGIMREVDMARASAIVRTEGHISMGDLTWKHSSFEWLRERMDMLE